MSNIEDKVCEAIQQRASMGKAKYGTTMERTDLSEREWLQHAQEEALDLAVYLERLKEESCVLSKDDKFFIICLLDEFSNPTGDLVLDKRWAGLIKKKLQDALNLEWSNTTPY